MNMGSKDEVEKHEKELRKELDSKKKKNINWKAVEQLQALTFMACTEEIANITGCNAVSDMLEKFPYLEYEKVVRMNICLGVRAPSIP